MLLKCLKTAGFLNDSKQITLIICLTNWLHKQTKINNSSYSELAWSRLIKLYMGIIITTKYCSIETQTFSLHK